jgi:hypothetical protein
MNKPCTGTLYKIGGKYFCVGEKLSKKVNGKTITTYSKKSKKTKKNPKSKKFKKTNKTRKNKKY